MHALGFDEVEDLAGVEPPGGEDQRAAQEELADQRLDAADVEQRPALQRHLPGGAVAQGVGQLAGDMEQCVLQGDDRPVR